MSRLDDIQSFYGILAELELRCGGPRLLRDCTAAMSWPKRGVYFFLEDGEQRSTSGSGPRVVRVGTHALTAQSKATLWNRLAQHRGSAKSGGGNHRGSVFRLLLGEALLQKGNITAPAWGQGSSLTAAARSMGTPRHVVLEQEQVAERLVTTLLGTKPFLWLEVDPLVDGAAHRDLIERNAIALLSNFERESIDPPSKRWLGRFSGRSLVRDSGSWNSHHVEKRHDPAFLDLFAAAVRAMPHHAAASSATESEPDAA